MRVCVTGAAGFIGTWLCQELRDAGHEVYGADRNKGQYVDDQFDLLEYHAALDWIERYRPDSVVHLAAQVGRLFGEDDIGHTVRHNAEMTATVVQAAQAYDAQMVYASTSEVYGDHGDTICYENTPWVLPHNIYGLSKGWGEQVCQLYVPSDRLVIVRLSMPYGPGVAPGRGRRAMDTFLWQAHHRMPLTVHRRGERSWCWVGDTVRGIRMAMEHPVGGAYNIGRDDDPRSMLELAQMACKIAGAPDDLIEEIDPPTAQTVVKRLSTDAIRSIGWQPTLELEDGMTRVFNWVKGYDVKGNR